jgi:hypothetical protein
VKFGENVLGLVCECKSHEKHIARFIKVSESHGIEGKIMSFTEYVLSTEQLAQSNEMIVDIGLFCMLKFSLEDWQDGLSLELPF